MRAASPGIRQVRLYQRDRFVVGRFLWDNSATDAPSGRRESVIGTDHLLVIPRIPVRIRQHGSDPFVADTRTAVFYNRGQSYEAEQLLEDGEDSVYFRLDEQFVIDCAEQLGVRTRGASVRTGSAGRLDARRPLPFTHGPVDARAFAVQQEIAGHAACGHVDEIAIEELVALLSGYLLGLAFRAHGEARPGAGVARRDPAAHAAAERRRREAAEAARLILVRRFREPLRLTELADAVGLSTFHLCRVFRQHVGQSLHQYRTDLRLRAALVPLCEAHVDLVMLALELGFNSQSHFTSAFSRRFGCAPARFRRAVRSGRLPLPVTFLKDRSDPGC